MKKLFIREFTYRAYVYMPDGDASDAYDSFDAEILHTGMEPDPGSLTEVTPGKNPLAWSLTALVYHDGEDDIMLGSLMGGK